MDSYLQGSRRRSSMSSVQATLRKLLTYCVLMPTQPPTLGAKLVEQEVSNRLPSEGDAVRVIEAMVVSPFCRRTMADSALVRRGYLMPSATTSEIETYKI